MQRSCSRSWTSFARTLLAVVSPLTFPGFARAQVVQDTVLDNGLGVAVLEGHGVPLVTVLVAVRTGAFTQTPGTQGLAHLYEHVLFRSFGDEPTDFANRAGNLNAAYNGSTSAELVTYYLTLPSEGLDEAVELLASLVRDARFRDSEVAAEIPVVLDELARSRADPVGALRREMAAAMWGEDWYRRDVAGDSTTLRSIELDFMQSHFDRYHVPNNALVAVTGDATMEEVARSVSDHFGDWRPGADPFAEPPTPLRPLSRSTTVYLASETLEATIRLELRGPPASDTLATARIEGMVDLLNASASRFQDELVISGPFQTLAVGFERYAETSVIAFEGTVSPERTDRALGRLLSTLERMPAFIADQTAGLAGARGLWELDRALTMERTATLAPYVATMWGRGETHYTTRPPLEDAVATEEFFAPALDYVLGRPRILGVVGPQRAIALARAALDEGQ